MVFFVDRKGMSDDNTSGGKNAPSVAVEPHDDTLDTSAILRTGTFSEQLVYLFFCCIKTQITDLKVVCERVEEKGLRYSTHVKSGRLRKEILLF
jgi:hypothetical protein